MGSPFSVSVDGMDAITVKLNQMSKGMSAQIRRAVKSAAKDCYDDSQTNCPVGSDVNVSRYSQGRYQGEETTHIAGSLKGSGKITYPGDDDHFVAEVSYGGSSTTGQDVNYEAFVELGTCKMAAQPYLYPAFVYAQKMLQIDLQGIAALSAV